MAIYIQIKKVAETETSATYEFSSDFDAGKFGQLKIDKTCGEIQELLPYPEDLEKMKFARAARKVWLNHKKGEYPEVTSWSA
jgi:hypothetical protein